VLTPSPPSRRPARDRCRRGVEERLQSERDHKGRHPGARPVRVLLSQPGRSEWRGANACCQVVSRLARVEGSVCVGRRRHHLLRQPRRLICFCARRIPASSCPPPSPVVTRPRGGRPGTYALKTIHEVRQTADIDVRNPRGYHIRTCNGGRPIFLVAEPLPSVRHTTDHRSHTTDHRRSLRLSASLPPFPGDDDADGRLTVGKPDAAQQTLQRALLPDRQMSRSRQGRALLH